MTTLAAPTRAPLSLPRPAWVEQRWLWCLIGAVFVALRDFGTSGLLTSLGDTDDATRLVQVREWLAGAGWYDLLMPRFGGPTPLLSHWSRLIDVPIAALIVLFGLVLSTDGAELAARVVWPTLLLWLLLRLLVAEAEQRAGRAAGLIALALAVTSITGLYQFRVGRIDHHNAMIVLTVGGFLTLVRSVGSAHAAYAAGIMFGLALTIGYEPLLLIAPIVAILVLAGATRRDWTLPARNTTIGLAAALGGGLIVSTPPALWTLAPPCDAIGLNLVALSVWGAAGMWLVAARGAGWTVLPRVLATLGAGGIGAAFYVWLNPVCLGGPFALVSSEANALWLQSVLETKSAFATLDFQPVPIVVYIATASAAMFAAVMTYRRTPTMANGAMAVLILFVMPMATTQTKFIAYGSFLAVVPLAIAIASYDPGVRMSKLTARLIGVLIVCQSSLTGLATGVVRLAGSTPANGAISTVQLDGACLTTPALQPLGALPRGLVVAPADLGPFIVALTHHDVLAAPYHRIDIAIADSYKLFEMPVDAAAQRLIQLQADYLVDCLPAGSSKVVPDDSGAAVGLRARLVRGDALPFLTPLSIAGTQSAVRVWRIERVR